MKYKICIWENFASPHQTYFFEALNNHPEIDLQVRYFENFHEERVKQGWEQNTALSEYEQYVEQNLNKALETLPDWKNRVHILPGFSYSFIKQMIKLFIHRDILWVHWSERSGTGLARAVNYNLFLIKILHPILAKFKFNEYSNLINKYSLGVFAQGYLAKKDFIIWGVKESKIEYLFYTIGEISRKTTPKLFSQKKNKIKFVYIGALTKRKGIDILLKSFSLLTHSQNVILLLVGKDNSGKTYKQLAKKLNIDDNVFFTGPINMNEIANFMGAADILVLPTLRDGWGAVLNEAAALGKPMISTDQCGSAFHLIEDKANGFRIPAGNVKALANAMQFYIDNPESIQVHGKRSKEIYENGFTPQHNVERFISALNKWSLNEKY